MTCDSPATQQYVFCGLNDGLFHISVPLCGVHSAEEQPAETVNVLTLDFGDDFTCQGEDEPPWDRCACHPNRTSR